MKRLDKYKLLSLSLSLVLLMLAGCVAMRQTTTPEEILQQRVTGLMDAKMASRWDEVYTYYSKAYTEKISQQAFNSILKTIKFKKYVIKDIEIEPSGDKATVNLMVNLTLFAYDLESPKIQRWVLENGDWHLIVKPPTNPLMVE